MLRRLSHLFFGREEESPKDQRTPMPGVIDEEGWLLVSHHEAVSGVNTVEDQAVELPSMSVYACQSIPHVTEEREPRLETDVRMSEPDLPVQRSSTTSRAVRGSVSQAWPLAKVTHIARVQRAQAHSERRHLGRSGIQRQNCVRQRSQRHCLRSHTANLHQPGHRNFSH
ncbi:tumor protein p53-inducible nuclear protein 2 [Osmerus eperlanus]|uniref:tumor protein p53-inducible nuclear protein 2 n=1 Tax=Osmerus eperlanus TaxID=29151 RepID=UPI002E0DD785